MMSLTRLRCGLPLVAFIAMAVITAGLAAPHRVHAAPAHCGGHRLCVGPGERFATLGAAVAAARPGDVIELKAGTYHETVRINEARVTVRGMGGRAHIDCAGLKPVENKACILITGNGVTLDNLEISGAVVSRAAGANGACVRNGRNASFTLRRVVCHGSQEGVLTSGGDIVIDASQFYGNGWNGLTHNVYFNNCARVTVRGSIFRDAHVGHEFKSRCANTTIIDSVFRSTKGSRDLDIPDGGNVLVEGSTIAKAAGTQNRQLIGFTAESCRHPGDMVLKDDRIINADPHGEIRNFDRCAHNAIILEGVTFQGLPVTLTGRVEMR